MAELVQIVATRENGECPVALTDFIAPAEAASALANFKANGYGAREATRPKLDVRDLSGRSVPQDEKPKTSPDTSKK